MCTLNLCFEQKYENSQKNSTKNCHFYSREKSLYVVWACFRNGLHSRQLTVSVRVLVTFASCEHDSVYLCFTIANSDLVS